MITLNKVYAIISWIIAFISFFISWYILCIITIIGGISFWYDINFDTISNAEGKHLIMWYTSKQSRKFKILFSW